MIKLNNISYNYRKGAEALKNVSATIDNGIYIMLGENGAGKTTLLHIIAGLLQPTSGECEVDGENVWFRTPAMMERIFFLDNNMSFPADTIYEAAKIHSVFYPNFDKEMLQRNLAHFNMTGNEGLSKMSFGNRQKAQLAYALSLKCDVLLLDEPTNGLDISSKQQLQSMVAECTDENQTVIVSTHTVGDLENLYDGAIILKNGQVIISAPTEAICSKLLFKTSMSPMPGAIYSEMKLGLFLTIEPNEHGEFNDIDYVRLYNAVHNPESCQKLLSVMKK